MMGTNYYLRKKHKEEDKEELIRLIKEDSDYSRILDLVDAMYRPVDEYSFPNGGLVHLGKKSAGWKFLWNPNMIRRDMGHSVQEGTSQVWVPNYVIEKMYNLTKKSIREFCTKEGLTIVNEYGDLIDPEEFFSMAFKDEGMTSLDYYQKYPEEVKNCFYSFNKGAQELWKSLGFEFSKPYQTDFISDGLRFSTSISFS